MPSLNLIFYILVPLIMISWGIVMTLMAFVSFNFRNKKINLMFKLTDKVTLNLNFIPGD